MSTLGYALVASLLLYIIKEMLVAKMVKTEASMQELQRKHLCRDAVSDNEEKIELTTLPGLSKYAESNTKLL
jgi:hypothetical protein